MPAPERQRLCDRFNQFFEQDPSQQNQTLTVLTDDERRQMQQTLSRFANLSPEQRRTCIASFEKFATMTPEERAQFLKNADRWEAMSREQRALWTDLVRQYPLMPPMPEGMALFPPVPPGMGITAAGVISPIGLPSATNLAVAPGWPTR